MTIRTRRILFFFFFIIFVFLSVGAAFYSNGWRFDFENFSFQKTGAIYIETFPKGAEIYLDDKIFPNQSGLMKKGTLIPDLLPKIYNIRIAKDGYFDYFKNIKIEPSLVSELIDTVLIPKNPESEEIFSNKLRGDKIIDLKNEKIIAKDSSSGVYYLYETNNQLSVFNLSVSFNGLNGKGMEIKKAIFHPFDNNKLIIENASGLYIFDKSRLKTEAIFKNSSSSRLAAWDNKNSSVYFIKEEFNRSKKQTAPLQTISSFNLMMESENLIFQAPTGTEKISDLKTSDSGSKIALLNAAAELFILDAATLNLKKIGDNVKNFSFSPDNKKLAFVGKNNKIYVYFIEDWRKNFKAKAGEIINFNLTGDKPVKNIFWRKDSFHLIVERDFSKNLFSADFLEIDNRQPQNIFNLISEKNGVSDFFYDAASDNLYFIQDNRLKFSKFE